MLYNAIVYVQALDETATKLIRADHYASDEVDTRRKAVLKRRSELLEQATIRRSQLDESHSLQQFLRDTEDAKNWVNEKNKTARDESYKDPSNLEAKIQQHQDFESELLANKGRIDAVSETGSDLMDADHFATEEIRCNKCLVCRNGIYRMVILVYN